MLVGDVVVIVNDIAANLNIDTELPLVACGRRQSDSQTNR